MDGAQLCESCKDVLWLPLLGVTSVGVHRTLQSLQLSCSVAVWSPGTFTGPDEGQAETAEIWSYPRGTLAWKVSGLLGLRGFLGVMTSERKCQANAEKTLEAAGQEEW